MHEHSEEKTHITSVEAFLKLNSSWMYLDFNATKWVYRGHDNFDYKLIPSLGRLLNRGAFNTKERLFDFEQSAFNEFRISSYSQLREKNQFILLAVAQHHGLRTRLLDWTFSPLAALFFAVENEQNHNKDGALIGYQPDPTFNNFPDNCKSPFDENLHDFHFIFCPDISPRISAQSGIFQLFKHPTEDFSNAYSLMKFKIPAAAKKRIKEELETLGITYRTMFPGLDGICGSINYNKLRA